MFERVLFSRLLESLISVFNNVGERCTAKNYRPVSLLSVVSKVFKKLVNNKIVDHLEKFGLFSDFQYGFRSSRSTANLLTVVSNRIARAFNRSGVTRAVALEISKAFDRVWHASLFHKLTSYGTSGQIFRLISSFLSNRRLRVVLDGKSSQEYPVNTVVPQGSILGPTLSYCYHVWAGAPLCYLGLLDKLQKRICTIVGPSFPASLEPLAHR